MFGQNVLQLLYMCTIAHILQYSGICTIVFLFTNIVLKNKPTIFTSICITENHKGYKFYYSNESVIEIRSEMLLK